MNRYPLLFIPCNFEKRTICIDLQTDLTISLHTNIFYIRLCSLDKKTLICTLKIIYDMLYTYIYIIYIYIYN